MCTPGEPDIRMPHERDVLLWCMRVWAMQCRRPVNADRRILEAMTLLESPDSAELLDGLMEALRQGATRDIAIGCTCRRAVSDDEHALLDSIALAQHGRRFEALLLLRAMLQPEAGQDVLSHAERLGAALSRIGRFLPTPEYGMRLCAHGGDAQADRPGNKPA